MSTPAPSVSALAGTFLAHSTVRDVLQSAFRGGLAAMEDAGFESEAIEGLVQLADGADNSPWALERLAVLRDPCTNNYVQLCANLSMRRASDRPTFACMRLQLHELDLPVPEYGAPKSVLVDVSLLQARLDEPADGLSQELALQQMVAQFTNGEAPSTWAGTETQERFKQAFENALLP